MVAPGVELYSAYPGDNYAWWSGTSMSCAVVSGAIARLGDFAEEPNLDDISGAVKDGAHSVDNVNPGLEDLLGEGLVRMDRALEEL